MDLIKRGDLNKELLPGRVIQKAVGKDAPSKRKDDHGICPLFR